MTERDESNINFVLSLDVNGVAEWLSDMDEDEMCYALSIIECAHWKLLDESVQETRDCKQARKLLTEMFHV